MSSLPLILVSAKTQDDADHIISKLLETEAAESGEYEGVEQGAGGARVWRLANKYYRATVELRPAPDAAPLPPHPPTGHLIYLAHDEMCSDEAVSAVERRAGAGAGAAVRVLAADAECLDGALLAWAARHRVEPVALREEGVEGVRAALHAHPWPGLCRREREPEPDACNEEAWAAALEALAPAAAAARALSGAERRAAAESVLAAFCHAIGEDMDEL